MKQRGFAGTRWSDDGKKFAAVYVEIDSTKRAYRHIAGLVNLL